MRHTKTTIQIRHGRSLVSGFAEWTCFPGKARGLSSSQGATAHCASGQPVTSRKLLQFCPHKSHGEVDPFTHSVLPKLKLRPSPQPPRQVLHSHPTHFSRLLLPQESHTQANLPNLLVPQMAVGPMARCPGAQWALSLVSPFTSFALGSFSFLSVSLLAPVSKGRTLPLGSHDSDHIPSKEGQPVSKPNLGPAISFQG